MGLPGVSSTSLLEVLFHLLQVTGTTPAQGLKQQQSWAETLDCNSGTQHPCAQGEQGTAPCSKGKAFWDRHSDPLDTVGVGLGPGSARLDVPGSFKSAEAVSCLPGVMSPGRAVGTLSQEQGGGLQPEGSYLSATLSGCSDVMPRSSTLGSAGAAAAHRAPALHHR